ncbi:hypothetical protein C0Q70_06891 [Pomacea canaliculata]|uniref:Uncharacterized protein n=1 Tax=Pomacea canaliculata TaxID=400727 RepID=A0A2T7PDJ5_POMCA|nr:uncharacterized protein LOC112562096 [Pomacea canaliculata]XP_025090885.1 uncharacterized protein LOC112562096 [Pomacea canaliculata]XP_025090886.1 uncharacterized protein LOC112562096 [Pomacea canaliculata]PVD31479.1 hypothetical protein C0Q70_06891 [Pomacea canaliculata]
MAQIERKVRFLGIWHENVITDTTMRQIIARAHAEKGQKARLRLTPKGLSVSRTVVFQEQSLTAFPLHNIYFLTLNQRHPTCLLCIVADPTRKYGIVAVKAATVLDAQQIIDTFNRLKNDPTLQPGNVVLSRKEDGNWTLRDRSVHNVNRHLTEVFHESPPGTPVIGTISNGEVVGYSRPTNPPVLNHEGEMLVARTSSGGFGYGSRMSTSGGSQNGDLTDIRNEVEHLSRELQDIRVMVERGGSRRESSSSKHMEDGSHYISSEVRAMGGDLQRNGRIPTDEWIESRPGEARVVVTDHRKGTPTTSTAGVVHAHGGGNLTLANGRMYRQITVPEALPRDDRDPASPTDTIVSGHHSHYEDVDQTFMSLPSAYSVRRRVSPERVPVPQDKERKWSASSSIASSRMGSGHVTFNPAVYHHGRESKSRTLRYKAGLSVPSTVVRPIEETYRLPKNATWRRQQHVYVVPDAQGHLVVTPAAGVVPGRRMRPASVHVMQGNGLRVFDEREELDDAFL